MRNQTYDFSWKFLRRLQGLVGQPVTLASIMEQRKHKTILSLQND